MITRLRQHVTSERMGWFGAGLSAAAVGLAGYELAVAPVLPSPLAVADGGRTDVVVLGGTARPTATAWPTRTPHPTATAWPTHTPHPTATPWPTYTPWPTRTPFPTRTPWPTRTPLPGRAPWPTRTPRPTQPDALATGLTSDPHALAAAVATLVSHTNDSLETLRATPIPR